MEQPDGGEAVKLGGEVGEEGSKRNEMKMDEQQKIQAASGSVAYLPDLDLLLGDGKGAKAKAKEKKSEEGKESRRKIAKDTW